MRLKLLLSGAFLCLSLLTANAKAAEEQVLIGEVKYVVGEAKVGDNELKVGSKIFNEDVLTTENGTTLRILMADGVAIQVYSNTKLRFVRDEKKALRVSLNVGSILSKIKKLPTTTSEPRYMVNTKHASMGVRGTTFFVKLAKGEGTFLCVCEGAVNVTRGPSAIEVSAKHHENAKIISAIGLDSAADMGKDHSDKDIAALEKLLK